MSIKTVVVTRHQALVDYLIQTGIIPPDARVIAHAREEDVAGKHVIGVLPLRLAALAASVTEVPLDLPPELRGVELTLEQVHQYAGPPVTYEVMTVENACPHCGSRQYWGGYDCPGCEMR